MPTPDPLPPSDTTASAAPTGEQSTPQQKVALATAIATATCLRDLAEITYLYSGVLPPSEQTRLASVLLEHHSEACETAAIPPDLRITKPRPWGKRATLDALTAAEVQLIAIDPRLEDATNAGEIEYVRDDSAEKCLSDVQSIATWLVNVMRLDCRIPSPADDESYTEPRRVLQLLDEYWQLAERLLRCELSAPRHVRPHPHAEMILNLADRIRASCELLAEAGYEALVAHLRQMPDALLAPLMADVGDVSTTADEVRSVLQKTRIDLARLQLQLGHGTFPFTRAEQECLSRARTVIHDYYDSLRTAASDPAASGAQSPPTSEASIARSDDMELRHRIPDDVLLSVRQLVDIYDVPYDALDGRLRRWRQEHPDGWRELSERRRNDPNFLYLLGEVRPILRELNAKDEKKTENS